MTDPRIITAITFYVVGIAAVSLALRIWWTHPINRVFSLGPFVTEAGLSVLLRNVNLIFALGVFALVAGGARHAHWAAARGCRINDVAIYLSYVELFFGLWAAGCVIVAAWRVCRKR